MLPPEWELATSIGIALLAILRRYGRKVIFLMQYIQKTQMQDFASLQLGHAVEDIVSPSGQRLAEQGQAFYLGTSVEGDTIAVFVQTNEEGEKDVYVAVMEPITQQFIAVVQATPVSRAGGAGAFGAFAAAEAEIQNEYEFGSYLLFGGPTECRIQRAGPASYLPPGPAPTQEMPTGSGLPRFERGF